MSTSDHILFLILVHGVLVSIGIGFSFALPTPTDKYKSQSPRFARYFLFLIWCGFAAIGLHPLGYPLLSVATLNICMLSAMYMFALTVYRRYGKVLRRTQGLLILGHLVICELFSLYFFLGDNVVLYRRVFLMLSVLVPLVSTLKVIFDVISQQSGGDELTLLIVGLATAGVVFGVPAYLFTLDTGESVSINVAFLGVFIFTVLFMLGFPTSLMQSLFVKLRSQIYIDALTGVNNRHFFYKETPRMLAHCRRDKRPFSMVVCDIDHFKDINDRFGHADGDIALKCFASVLSASLRQGDSLVRMGGEEFLILLPDSDLAQASAMAERLRESVATTVIVLAGAKISLTSSFGVTTVIGDDTLLEGMRQADEALYRAKASGRNQVKRAQR